MYGELISHLMKQKIKSFVYTGKDKALLGASGAGFYYKHQVIIDIDNDAEVPYYLKNQPIGFNKGEWREVSG